MRSSTNYALAGPKTFRRGSKKILKKWGSNLQNIEESMREIYQSDGYKPELHDKCSYWLETGDLSVFSQEELETLRVLCPRDQSGAEALIVAYECEPFDYRKLFIHGIKPHVYIGLRLFPEEWKRKIKEHSLGIDSSVIDTLCATSIPDLKSNPDWSAIDKLIKSSDGWATAERYYYFAKQTCHSGNYGIEWATFIMNVLDKSGGKVVLTKEQGVHFLQTYRALFPELVERCNRITHQAKETKMLFNMFGHPYTITDYEILPSRYKELWAWSAQSTVAEITRTAFSNLQYWIEDNKKQWDILEDNHDSFLPQCPLYELKECMKMSEQFMNIELISPVDGVKFRMKSECKIGFNWSNKTDKNKLGLREIKW